MGQQPKTSLPMQTMEQFHEQFGRVMVNEMEQLPSMESMIILVYEVEFEISEQATLR